VEQYEARCRGIRSLVRHLSTGKSGTPETSRIAATFKDLRVEMGRDRNGLLSWVAVTPHVSNPHDYVNYMFKRP
jgi:hypothetical protein